MIGLFIAGNLDSKSNMTVKAVVKTLLDTNDNIFVVTNLKNKFIKLLGDVYKERIIEYNIKNCKDYKDAIDLSKKILKDNDIKKLIIYKSILCQGYDNSNMSLAKSFINNIENECYDKMWNYVSVRNVLLKFTFIMEASKYCDSVYDFVLDPQEPRYDKVLKFNNYKTLYGMVKNDMFYMPCFEYGVKEICNKLDKNKTNDFIFYCGAVTDDRKFIAEQKEKLESLENCDIKIFLKKQRPLPQNEYYEKLAKSKYTICIKAYDKTAFSMYRLIEALECDCLSFIMKDCCLDDVKNTFEDIYDILINNLIVEDFDEAISKCSNWDEDKRKNIINDIKNTPSYKKIMNKEFIKKRWGKIL